MDDLDHENWLVLGNFAVSLVAVIVGYLVAIETADVSQSRLAGYCGCRGICGIHDESTV